MSTLLDIKSLKNGEIFNDVVVFLKDYSKKSYSNGQKFFIVGNVANKTDVMPFKIWDAQIVEILGAKDITGSVIKISGQVTEYMKKLELKVEGISTSDIPSDITPETFMKSVDVPVVFQNFVDIVNNDLSENAIKVLMGIFQAEKLFDRFKEEFAGSKMHDAQIGGLMNHTVKMLRFAQTLVINEPRLLKLPHYKDLLFLGIILHDIGKVHEMKFGVYQENSFVTHRTLGMEMIMKYKSLVVQLFDETFYYQLLAIVQGHHGEFGDAPTTLLAYLVHLIDMVDAMSTGAFDKIENNDVNNKAGHTTIYAQNTNLVVK